MRKLLLIAIIILAGCTTDEKKTGWELPEATQVGANTFGTYIDGIPFFPRSGTGLYGVPDYGMTFMGGYPEVTDYNEIGIFDYRSENTGQMLIHIQDLHELGEGIYVVDESNGMSNIDGYLHNYIHCRIFRTETNSFEYYLSFENSGVIEITRYDFENGVISGTFSCTLRNATDPTDQIEVTQGRFDINGYTLPQVVFP